MDGLDFIIGVLEDCWGGQCAPGQYADTQAPAAHDFDIEIPVGATMPYVCDGHLVLSNFNEINDDIAGRLDNQLVSIIRDNTGDLKDGFDYSPQQAAARIKAYRALAASVRKAGC